MSVINKIQYNGQNYDLQGQEIYSDQEIVIGTWFGKPLYRKVVIAENLSTDLNNVPHNIANLDKIITLKGNFVRKDGVKGFCPKIWGSTNWWVSFNDTTDTYVSVAVGTSHTGQYAISRFELVLEYTKTTDNA